MIIMGLISSMQRFIFIWLFLFAVSLYAEENDSVGRTPPAPLGGESGERTWSVGREAWSVKREAWSAEHWGWQLDVNPWFGQCGLRRLARIST